MRRHLTRLARLSMLLAVVLLPDPTAATTAQEDGEAQDLGRYGLPDIDRGARNRVIFRLNIYYHYMSRIGGIPFDPIVGCDADEGERCYDGGDWESNCRRWRCRTEEEVARFVDELVKLAEQFPHSPEAVGHAVYAAVRLDHTPKVEGVLDRCEPGDAWWCDLLRGYLLHAQQRSAEAETPIERALRNAPPETRCSLEDASLLLPDDIREAYRALDCEARVRANARIWWLADPFWIDPGNDRRVEHLMRGFSIPFHETRLLADPNRLVVHSDAHQRARITRGYRDSWAPPGGVRERDPESLGYTSRRGAFNHFLPDSLDLFSISPRLSWRIAAEQGDEGWTRPSGPVLAAPAQAVRFLEGVQLSIALASDLGRLTFEPPWAVELPEDSTDATSPAGQPAERPARMQPGGVSRGDDADVVAPGQAYFVTSEGPGHLAEVDPVPIRERVTFAVDVPNRPQVAGLEVFSPAASARHRVPVLPLSTSQPEVSDLLLFRPYGPDLPETRLRAIALMHGTREITNDQRLGIYWEGYGLPRDEPIEVAISIAGTEVGLLDRVGGLIGFGAGDARTTVNWTEPRLDEEALFRRSVTINLEGIEPGRQEVVLELTLADGRALERRVAFTVVEAEEGNGADDALDQIEGATTTAEAGPARGPTASPALPDEERADPMMPTLRMAEG